MMLNPVLILSLFAWSVSASAGPDPRNPTGSWVVNFADAQCVASRNYGTAEDPLHLVLKAPPLGEVMQVAVMKEGPAGRAQQVEASIRLDGARPLKTNMLMFSPPKQKIRAYVLNMPAADFALVRQAKALSIHSEGLNETFAVSGMDPLLKIVQDCVADLRQVWNIADPEGTRSTLPQRAVGELARYFRSNDYPFVAIQQNATGVVRFAILIDETGRVADCTIIETSGVAALDTQTCNIAQGAKFQPARGSDSKPAKDAAIQQVNWRLIG